MLECDTNPPIQNSQRNQPYSMTPNHKQPTNLIAVTMQQENNNKKRHIFNHNQLQLTIVNHPQQYSTTMKHSFLIMWHIFQ